MDLSQVTLSQMRYAVSVAETANFRLAAAKCAVSQSGLSMQIQKLEELLDTVLFDRSKKPVLITDEGRVAIGQMRQILQETERLGQLVSETSEPAGRYRLAVIPTLSATIVPLFLGEFLRSYPRVELIIEEMKTEDIIQALKDDTIDAGIAATPLHVEGLDETVLGVEEMFAYLPADDRLLKRKSLKEQHLQERDLWVMPEGHCFRTQVLSYCARDAKPESGPVHFESGNFQTLISLVDEGLGATILPELVASELPAARRRKQVRPFSGAPPLREIGLVRSREDLRAKVTEALLHVLKPSLDAALKGCTKRGHILDPLESE